MKNELKKLEEGQQVVTIVRSPRVPKVLNVTIRNEKYYDTDFYPHLIWAGSFEKVPFIDCFGGKSGEIPRDKVWDYNQVVAEYMTLNRITARLINDGDINKSIYDETYLMISPDNVQRPNGEEKIDGVVDIASLAAECFRLQHAIDLLTCVDELDIERYNAICAAYTPYKEVPKIKRHK